MRKIFNIFISLLLMFVFIPVSVSLGQYVPNAPFKPQYPDAPDFTLRDVQGKTFRLSALRGKPVLIFFGATWCPGCRAEIPYYKKVYETYSPRGLEVIYVNIMEPAKKVTRFVQAHSLPYRVLIDENGDVANQYNIMGVPTILLVDKEGHIINAGHSSSEIPLERLLKAK